MKTNETILQIIDQGYMLTFFEKPSEAKFRSGLTNLTNSLWQILLLKKSRKKVIEDMILSGTTKQLKTSLEAINPLFVSSLAKEKTINIRFEMR